MRRILLCLILSTLLAACSGAGMTPAPTPLPPPATPVPAATASPAAAPQPVLTEPVSSPTSPVLLATRIASPTPTTAPTPTLAPDFWQRLPVIPTAGERAREIYRRGQQLGLDPAAFSKVGDCEATSTWFLSMFDGAPDGYDLGDYAHLSDVIAAFPGSWKRDSLAVKAGFRVASVMSPLWADPKLCQPGETPLACELRLHRPAFALIMLGSNNASQPEKFEPQLRALLDSTIAQGVVPILATKADNIEGDHAINATIARLALEYDIPLWNFWAAVQPLPRHGLQDDGAHLTLGAPDFDDPYAMQTAWAIRNLTALQVIDAVWRGVQE